MLTDKLWELEKSNRLVVVESSNTLVVRLDGRVGAIAEVFTKGAGAK